MAKRVHKPIVFVVEDDESVRRSFARLIRAEGYEVRLFESPERFLEEVTPTPGACVVLDISMPRMTGIDVQDQLKAREIGMPVIVVSARDDNATRRRAKQSGAKFFFRKPVDEATLIDAIDWAVNSDEDTDGE